MTEDRDTVTLGRHPTDEVGQVTFRSQAAGGWAIYFGTPPSLWCQGPAATSGWAWTLFMEMKAESLAT